MLTQYKLSLFYFSGGHYICDWQIENIFFQLYESFPEERSNVLFGYLNMKVALHTFPPTQQSSNSHSHTGLDLMRHCVASFHLCRWGCLWPCDSSGAWKKTKKQTNRWGENIGQDQQIHNIHTLHLRLHNCRMKDFFVKELKPRWELLVPGSIRLPPLWACVLCAAAFVSQKRLRWDERLSLAWNLHTNAAAAPKSRHGVKTMILKSRMFFKVVRCFFNWSTFCLSKQKAYNTYLVCFYVLNTLIGFNCKFNQIIEKILLCNLKKKEKKR